MKESEYLSKIVESQDKLRGYLRSIHPFAHEVDDILQEANITLLKKRKGFDPSREFLPWAFGVTRWTWMAYKQKRRRANERISYLEEDVSDVLADRDPEEVDREYEHKEKLQQIKNASSHLPPLDKSIFDMYCDGKKIAEISQELDICVRILSARKRRMMQKLKKIVNK